MERVISSEGINFDKTKNESQKRKRSTWNNILKSKLYDGNVSAGAIKHSKDIFDSESKLNRSLVVYGMSLHTMTDTFAHSSWGYGKYAKEKKNENKEWKEKWQWGTMKELTNEYKANDNKKIRPQRYKAARQAVLNSMDNIVVTDDGIIIKKSKTLDFSSRGYKKNMPFTAKGTKNWEIININGYICYNEGKPVAIEMEYFENGKVI